MPNPIPNNRNIYIELKHFPKKYEMPYDIYKDFYGLSFTVQGERKITTPNLVYIVYPGNVTFIDKDVYHRSSYLSNTSHGRYLLKFTKTMINGLLEEMNISSINELLPQYLYCFEEKAQSEIENIFQNILNEYEKYDSYSELIIKGMLQQLILIIKREHLPVNKEIFVLNNANEKILSALEYIEINFARTPSIVEVADYIGFSSSHFSRIFKEATNVPYSTYLKVLKVQYAKTLLCHTKKNLEEIAEECGFRSGNYLSNQFKNIYDVRPSEYRKFSYNENN